MRMAKKMALACVLFAAAAVQAQQPFPSKPVRILVGFTAGSGTDFLARVIGQKLSEQWGQPVVVDNRAGAGGTIAADILQRSAPDGYTLMVAANGHAVNAILMSTLPYDTVKDFSGVTYIGDVPNVLLSAPGLQLKSVRDLLALAKAKPGQLNYGSAGSGSSTHINSEVFKLAAGIQALHVPFKGSPDLITNVINDSVSFTFIPIPTVVSLVKGGRVTALAVSTKSRSPVLPDLPSIAESGVPGFDFTGWYAMFAPARTPASVKSKIALDVAGALAAPEVRARLLTQGATASPSSPEKLDAFVKEEIGRMAKVIKAAGIPIQ